MAIREVLVKKWVTIDGKEFACETKACVHAISLEFYRYMTGDEEVFEEGYFMSIKNVVSNIDKLIEIKDRLTEDKAHED